MCGLNGVLLYPSRRTSAQWRSIIDIATANMVFNEERGRDAAGIAVIQRNGEHLVFKAPLPASEFVTLDLFHKTMATVGRDTTCILAHTRKPTKGSPSNNLNNHPIETGHVVGIHNGILDNDDELFVDLQLPRAGEVDSEVIFRLLDQIPPSSLNGARLDLVHSRIDMLRGSFATLSVDLRAPTRLLVVKNLRPLCLHYEEDLRALFFSSRYLFLRRAFGRAVITEALPNYRGYYFDARRLPENGCLPLCSFQIAGRC